MFDLCCVCVAYVLIFQLRCVEGLSLLLLCCVACALLLRLVMCCFRGCILLLTCCVCVVVAVLLCWLYVACLR